jgi:pimeloyl-ACP methyl ester carboxylesterase
MLAAAKVPMLLTHHARRVDDNTGKLMGALTDLQARRAGELVKGAGQPFDYASLPDAAHAMHEVQPERFATIVRDWAKQLPT